MKIEICFLSCDGDKYKKAKEWKVPTVSIQWLNDVFFGSMNAVQCMNNPKYQNFRLEDPFKIEYPLVQNLMIAWKTPIKVTPVRKLFLQNITMEWKMKTSSLGFYDSLCRIFSIFRKS